MSGVCPQQFQTLAINATRRIDIFIVNRPYYQMVERNLNRPL